MPIGLFRKKRDFNILIILYITILRSIKWWKTLQVKGDLISSKSFCKSQRQKTVSMTKRIFPARQGTPKIILGKIDRD